jgi:hypothetical protein
VVHCAGDVAIIDCLKILKSAAVASGEKTMIGSEHSILLALGAKKQEFRWRFCTSGLSCSIFLNPTDSWFLKMDQRKRKRADRTLTLKLSRQACLA